MNDSEPHRLLPGAAFFLPTDHMTTYPFVLREPWEAFIGALLSASDMPDKGHPLYIYLERAARRVFDRFSTDGLLAVRGETELYLGPVVDYDG